MITIQLLEDLSLSGNSETSLQSCSAILEGMFGPNTHLYPITW